MPVAGNRKNEISMVFPEFAEFAQFEFPCEVTLEVPLETVVRMLKQLYNAEYKGDKFRCE